MQGLEQVRTFGGVEYPEKKNIPQTKVIGKQVPAQVFLHEDDNVIAEVKATFVQPVNLGCFSCKSQEGLAAGGLIEVATTKLTLTPNKIVCYHDYSGSELGQYPNQKTKPTGPEPAVPKRNALQQFQLKDLVAVQTTFASVSKTCCRRESKSGTMRLFFNRYPDSTAMGTDEFPARAAAASPMHFTYKGTDFFSEVTAAAALGPESAASHVLSSGDGFDFSQLGGADLKTLYWAKGGPRVLASENEIRIQFYGEKGAGEFDLQDLLAFQAKLVAARGALATPAAAAAAAAAKVGATEGGFDMCSGMGDEGEGAALLLAGRPQINTTLVGLGPTERVLNAVDATPKPSCCCGFKGLTSSLIVTDSRLVAATVVCNEPAKNKGKTGKNPKKRTKKEP